MDYKQIYNQEVKGQMKHQSVVYLSHLLDIKEKPAALLTATGI